MTALTAEQLAALTPTLDNFGGASINSPLQITFAISDGAATKNPIKGLTTTQLRFTLAKLVPGTNGGPSKWVSYIVTSTTGALSKPTSDNTGTLTDNGNGTYSYTFSAGRDPKTVKATVAALTGTGLSQDDLDALTYDANAVHRVGVQLSGSVGVNAIGNPMNAVYDFIPATGKAVTAADPHRKVVAISSCNECHEKLALHGGGRIDTDYCVTCHTDQRKYGVTTAALGMATSTALAFPALIERANVDPTTGITRYVYSKSSSTTASTSSSYHPNGGNPVNVGDGEVMGNFPVMVHKIHNGEALVKKNYNYANIAFNLKGFSMLGEGQRMCAKCHDNTKAADADNWKNVPTRLACGSCHDGINFATGAGTTLSGATTGHAGVNLAQSNDSGCVTCHGPSGMAPVAEKHYTDNKTLHNQTVATGLSNFEYGITSAAVDATSNDLTIKFWIKKDGTKLTSVATPPTGFTGSPGFILAYATTQDGVTTPADFNNSGRANAQAKTYAITTATGPDTNGDLTLVVPSASAFPAGAKMRTVALQSYYTQTAFASGRHTLSAVATVTGDTARREVVDPEKCSNCHEWFEGHGGSRVIGRASTGTSPTTKLVCVLCHVPGMASSGRGATSAQIVAYRPSWTTKDKRTLADWGLDPTTFGNGVDDALQYPVVTNNFKDMIHGIHAGRDRVTPFRDARNRGGVQTLLDFRRMDFPGILNNCATCHKTGTYSSVPASALASTYELINAAYLATPTAANASSALTQTSANTTDTVTTPFAGACVSCHDSAAAQGHMVQVGGALIKGTRAQFQTKVAASQGEGCALCHGTGKSEDIAVKHQ